MKRSKMIHQICWIIAISIILPGCSTLPFTPSSPEDSKQPQPDFEVIFDGNDCIVTGPSELPAGEVTTHFTDKSELDAELWLVYIDEGKTFQDHLDLQEKPGDWYPKPSWDHYATRIYGHSEDINGARVDIETWNLDHVAEHIIFCYVSSPQMIWFAHPLFIVEAEE